ncbi:MAG: tetratricopeptide repeat-containing sensor histidine kinase [Bacteroidota bacterium]
MKKSILSGILFLLAIRIFAQYTGTAEEPAFPQGDRQKVDELTALCSEFVFDNPQQALQYGEKGLKLARSLNYDEGTAAALTQLAAISHMQHDYDQAIILYKEAISIYYRLDMKKPLADNLSGLGVVQAAKGDFSEAQFFFTQALDIYNLLADKKKISEILKDITTLYQVQGGHSEMLEEIEMIRNTDGQKSNQKIKALRYLGLIYYYMGNYSESLKCYKRGLEIAEQDNSILEICRLCNNIGILYKENSKFEQAVDYYLRALEIEKKMANTKNVSNTLKYLAMVYEAQGNLERSTIYYLRAINVDQNVADSTGIAYTCLQLGKNYLLQSRFDRASEFIERAIKTGLVSNDQFLLASAYFTMGQMYQKQNIGSAAEICFVKALDIATDIKSTTIIKECFQNLAAMYSKGGDYRKAFEYTATFSNLKDSMYNVESTSRFRQLQSKFEIDMKQKQYDMLRKNFEINQLTMQNQSTVRNFLIALLVLIGIFLFMLYNRFIAARKSNILLNTQKAEIALVNEELLQLNVQNSKQNKITDELNKELLLTNDKLLNSEKRLTELIVTKDKFFSIISHDLRNPFASIIGFARIVKRDLKKLTTDEMDELLHELDKSVCQVNSLLDNILQWSRSQTGKILFTPEHFELIEPLNAIINLLQSNIKVKEINIHISIQDNFLIYADRNMLDVILRNLVSNAIKFSSRGGNIDITAHNSGDTVSVSVKDNGTGMSPESVERLFKVGESFSKHGTDDEKGSGLGLILCKEFIDRHQGKIFAESVEGKGSTFTFVIPFNNPQA